MNQILFVVSRIHSQSLNGPFAVGARSCWDCCSHTIKTTTNLVRYVPHLFKASWRRCPHFPSNVTGAWSNHSANICNNLLWGWYVFYVIFDRFFPVGHITFPFLLLVKSFELRETPIWPPTLESILYTMVISLSVESDRKHDLTILSKCVMKRCICRCVWYIVFYVIFMSRERQENSLKIQASPLETCKWLCYEES